MLNLQTKTSDGIESRLKGKEIEEVYCLNDEYHESSDKRGFTAQVFEFSDGTFLVFPPAERTTYFIECETLAEIYEHVRQLRNQDLI